LTRNQQAYRFPNPDNPTASSLPNGNNSTGLSSGFSEFIFSILVLYIQNAFAKSNSMPSGNYPPNPISTPMKYIRQHQKSCPRQAAALFPVDQLKHRIKQIRVEIHGAQSGQYFQRRLFFPGQGINLLFQTISNLCRVQQPVKILQAACANIVRAGRK